MPIHIITGGAAVTDTLAEHLALQRGLPCRVIIGPLHPRIHQGIQPLHPSAMAKALPHVRAVAQALGKTLANPYTEDLLARNYHIVKEVDTVFAFGRFHPAKTLPEVPLHETSAVEGGTGWSVAVAKRLGKRLFFYDVTFNRWYKYSPQYDFLHSTVISPTLSHRSPIVGARQLYLYPRAMDELKYLFQASQHDQCDRHEQSLPLHRFGGFCTTGSFPGQRNGIVRSPRTSLRFASLQSRLTMKDVTSAQERQIWQVIRQVHGLPFRPALAELAYPSEDLRKHLKALYDEHSTSHWQPAPRRGLQGRPSGTRLIQGDGSAQIRPRGLRLPQVRRHDTPKHRGLLWTPRQSPQTPLP